MASAGSFYNTSKSRPVDMTPWQFGNGFRTDLGNTLQEYTSGGGQQYGGPFVADIPDEVWRQLGMTSGMAQGGGSLESTIRGETERTARGDYLSPDTNPFLAATFDAASRKVGQELDQAELQNRSMFSRAGHKLQESSPFATAQGITNRAYSDAIGDIATNLYGGNYQAERDRQVGAATTGMQLDQFAFQRGLQNLEAQMLPQLVADLGIERGIAQYNEYLSDIMEALGISAQLANPSLGQYSKAWGGGTNASVASTG